MTWVQKFEPRAPLALEPRAFGILLEAREYKPADFERGSVAVVCVRGPLMHHRDSACESYASIVTRVEAALQTAAAVILDLDSPGGLVSGCFDTATRLRELGAEHGKPIVAYVRGQATSAAYALACGCSRIYSSASAVLGSIGVMDTVVDATRSDAAQGLRFAIVSSGARKADGNPHDPLTEEKLSAAQRSVDALAAQFFELVASARGVSVESVSGLEAAIFTGLEASRIGLVDEVATFDQALAKVAGGQAAAAAAEERDMDLEEALAALRKAAEGEDEEAKKAKKALAAFEEEKKDEDKTSASAANEGDEEKKDEDKTSASAASSSGAVSSIAALETSLRAERAERLKIQARLDEADRNAFLATRPDLSKELVASFKGMALDQIKAIVTAIPKGNALPPSVDHAAAAAATRGESQVGAFEGTTNFSGKGAELDLQMGLTDLEYVNKFDAKTGVQSFGVMVPKGASK